MTNKESLFVSLHILMRAITDGPEDAGRKLHRYWYRESRCQVRTGWQKVCALCGYILRVLRVLRGEKIREISVNPWLMNYLCAYKAPNKTLFWSFYVIFCTFYASLRLTRTVFSWLMKKAVSMALWTKASLCIKSSLLEQSLPRTPSRPKTSAISAFSAVKNSCLCVFVAINPFNQRNLCPRYPWLINDLRSTKDYVRNYKLFMENKANFQKVKLNVNKVLTRGYDQLDTWSIRKTKPIQSQFKANQSQFKANQSQLKPIKCQNKPNSNPIKANFKGKEGKIADGNCGFIASVVLALGWMFCIF